MFLVFTILASLCKKMQCISECSTMDVLKTPLSLQIKNGAVCSHRHSLLRAAMNAAFVCITITSLNDIMIEAVGGVWFFISQPEGMRSSIIQAFTCLPLNARQII